MGAPEYTLAIETSNPSAGPRGRYAHGEDHTILAGPGVALGRPHSTPGLRDHLEVVDAEALNDLESGSDDLMAAVDRLCRRAAVSPVEIGRVAVSVGPGGYTALRTAIAAAKMIAEATGARTVAVPSASVAAWCIAITPPALVCLASKGETTHATLLPAAARSGPWWEGTGRAAVGGLVGAEAVALLDELISGGRQWIAASCPIGVIGAAAVEAIRPARLIADGFLPEPIRAAARRIGAEVVEPIFAASSVLAISAHTPPVDPLTLAPTYPREPDAVTQWRRRVKGR